MGTRIVYAGSMIEGVIGSPKNTNPYKADNQTDKDLDKLLYTSLIRNLSGDKFDLGIAKSVEVSGDKKTYKVTLKDKIYFSNGTLITADDILFS